MQVAIIIIIPGENKVRIKAHLGTYTSYWASCHTLETDCYMYHRCVGVNNSVLGSLAQCNIISYLSFGECFWWMDIALEKNCLQFNMEEECGPGMHLIYLGVDTYSGICTYK